MVFGGETDTAAASHKLIDLKDFTHLEYAAQTDSLLNVNLAKFVVAFESLTGHCDVMPREVIASNRVLLRQWVRSIYP